MAYQPPENPTVPVTDYSMLQWFDPQAQQNAQTADWQKQWNAANFGSPAGGQGQDAGIMLPTGARPPTDANGQWVMSGSAPGQQGGEGAGQGGYTRWTFIPNQAPSAPVAAAAPPEAARPPQQDDGKTIYNDWDTYRQQARGAADATNRMPFVANPTDLIGLDRTQIANTFYPPAWQAQGVQKTIGPNGANIAPKLQSDFGNPNLVDTTSGKDWPSLVQMLMNSGAVDQTQGQALLGLTAPKKLDSNFKMAAMGTPQAGGGLAAMLGR